MTGILANFGLIKSIWSSCGQKLVGLSSKSMEFISEKKLLTKIGRKWPEFWDRSFDNGRKRRWRWSTRSGGTLTINQAVGWNGQKEKENSVEITWKMTLKIVLKTNNGTKWRRSTRTRSGRTKPSFNMIDTIAHQFDHFFDFSTKCFVESGGWVRGRRVKKRKSEAAKEMKPNNADGNYESAAWWIVAV